MAESVFKFDSSSITPEANRKKEDSINPRSFASISSAESGTGGHDVVDAVPQRMPLLWSGEDYIKHRQASVENLLSSRTRCQSPSRKRGTRSKAIYDAGEFADCKEREALLANDEGPNIENSVNPDPYSYFEMYDRDVSFFNGRAKSRTLPLNLSCSSGSSRSHSEAPHFLWNGKENASTDFHRQENQNARHSARSSIDCDTKPRNFTETDLVPKRRPTPSLKGANGDTLEDQQKSDTRPHNEMISTPPRAPQAHGYVEDQNCCDQTCVRLCCAMFKWKYLLKRFSVFDLCLTIGSMSIYIFDVVTDLLLALTFFKNRNEDPDYLFFFQLTLGLLIIPSSIMQMFSYVWVIQDFRYKKTPADAKDNEQTPRCVKVTAKDLLFLFLIAILHILQMGIFFRYIRALMYGFKSRYYDVKRKEGYRDHFDTRWKNEVHDVNFLRLMESFLESAPQLVLQVYIMLTKQVELINVISCIASLVGLSTAMVAIQRAIRNSNQNKAQLSIPASMFMLIWRAFTISSRVLAFSLFLTIQPLAFLVFILSHWALATIWIAVQKTNFCATKPLEYFFDAVTGVVYIFCFFNVHEGKNGYNRARYRMLLFYLVVLAENSVLAVLWFFYRPGGTTGPMNFDDFQGATMQLTDGFLTQTGLPLVGDRVIPTAYALALLLAVHGMFVMGMLFMITYYALLHPRRTTILCLCCCPRNDKSGGADRSVGQSVKDPGETMILRHENTPGDTASSSIAQHYNASDLENNISTQVHHASALDNDTILSEENQHETGKSANTSEVRSQELMWSDVLFNRHKRAQKAYTRQYSNEKILENDDKNYDRSRHTDRYSAVVTPPDKNNSGRIEKSQSQPKIRQGSVDRSLSLKVEDRKKFVPPILQKSKVIKPGSQASLANQVAQSNVQDLKSTASPSRSSVGQNVAESSNSRPSQPTVASYYNRNVAPHTLPRNSRCRGYSASMSCLVEERPNVYVAPRLRDRLTHTPSFILNANEVMECMESSL